MPVTCFLVTVLLSLSHLKGEVGLMEGPFHAEAPHAQPYWWELQDYPCVHLHTRISLYPGTSPFAIRV